MVGVGGSSPLAPTRYLNGDPQVAVFILQTVLRMDCHDIQAALRTGRH